jgi:co-chaperonin GroES (HSP10)
MKIIGNRVLVSALEELKQEGFQTVQVQDNFVYKGKVEEIGQFVAIAGNVAVGDTVLFAKYSPDTHEIEHEGKKYKVVEVSDILAVL